jgi:hypothetical protein
LVSGLWPTTRSNQVRRQKLYLGNDWANFQAGILPLADTRFSCLTMSTPPKFFGLIWAFFVEEAVWDLFLEGSEAKFAPWAVWQVRLQKSIYRG